MHAVKASSPISQFESRRFRTNYKISFRSPREDRYRNAYLLNLSMTGMFVRCEDPPAQGTDISFEIFPASGKDSVKGQAQVVWVRAREEGGDRPQGMGITIQRMSPEDRQLLREVVTQGLKQAGDLPEAEQLRSIVNDALGQPEHGEVDQPAGDAEAGNLSAPMAGDPISMSSGTYYDSTRKKRGMGFDILALAALLLLIGIGGSLFFLRGEKDAGSEPRAADDSRIAATSQQSGAGEASEAGGEDLGAKPGSVASESDTAPAPALPAATSEGGTSTVGSDSGVDGTVAAAPDADTQVAVAGSDPDLAEPDTVPAAEPPAQAPISQPPGPDHGVAGDAVQAWADAWSAQDVEGYLGSYAAAFDPPRNQGRRQWENSRRDKVAGPEFIRVTLSQLQVEKLGVDRAQATFQQEYRNNRMSDKVQKTLVLTWEDGRWKILEETVSAQIR